MQWIFFGPAMLVARWPDAGLVIGAMGIVIQACLGWRARRSFDRYFFREAPVFAGLLWVIFGFYERQMPTGAVAATANTGSAQWASFLRLDLMVLTPILYVLTAVAVYSVARQLRAKR